MAGVETRAYAVNVLSTCWAASESPQAFRHLGQHQHLGKLGKAKDGHWVL